MIKYDALVSVIVPVYGAEAYLPDCIESICKQSYKNLQIILVDDESPDKCPEICDNFAEKDDRIMVIHQENKGVSGARNTGLSYAVGDYLMFVDSDDELYPNAVEVLLNDVIKFGADIVSAKKELSDKSVKTVNLDEGLGINIYSGDEALLLSLNGDKNTNSVCAKLFKSEFIKGCLFEEGKNINEDGFFLFQCFLKRPILIQHDIYIYRYNCRENSNSRQTFSDKYLSMLYFCNLKKQMITDVFPQYTQQAYNMEVRTHLQFLQVLCRTNDKKYKETHKDSVKIIRSLYKYHRPIHEHHKKLAWIVAHGLYPVYKFLVRLKYYR